MELDITLQSAKPFDETVDALIASTAARGFRVQAVHDVSETLSEKGFERERVTIVEICNARYANEVLAADVRIGLMLPCPLMVYAQGERVMVSTMKPTLIAGFFPHVDLGEVPSEVEAIIVSIMNEATIAA